MRGFYMDEAFTGSPSDLQHISHDTNFTAKQWVDNTSASLAPIESTSTASQPYTVGKRLVYGGRLYKVTQAIAQGGTLTPGTNITPDTVDEELSTLSTQLSGKSTVTISTQTITNAPFNADGLCTLSTSWNNTIILSAARDTGASITVGKNNAAWELYSPAYKNVNINVNMLIMTIS